jgi:hypothetical protein
MGTPHMVVGLMEFPARSLLSPYRCNDLIEAA